MSEQPSDEPIPESVAVNQRLIIRELGMQDYQPVWHAMQSFTDNRADDAVDELWVLQHPPIFTQGQAGKAEHILMPGDIPVLPVDRGGQVTYHGPGQIVAYPLLDIGRRDLGVRHLVCQLEQAVINTLASLDIQARRREGMPGVYVGDDKIASLGLRVRKGRTFHGLAFNVDMDLEPFSRINPCGFSGLQVIDIQGLQAMVQLAQVQQILIDQILVLLGYTDHVVTQDKPASLHG